jgi:hypothetical protein
MNNEETVLPALVDGAKSVPPAILKGRYDHLTEMIRKNYLGKGLTEDEVEAFECLFKFGVSSNNVREIPMKREVWFFIELDKDKKPRLNMKHGNREVSFGPKFNEKLDFMALVSCLQKLGLLRGLENCSELGNGLPTVDMDAKPTRFEIDDRKEFFIYETSIDIDYKAHGAAMFAATKRREFIKENYDPLDIRYQSLYNPYARFEIENNVDEKGVSIVNIFVLEEGEEGKEGKRTLIESKESPNKAFFQKYVDACIFTDDQITSFFRDVPINRKGSIVEGGSAVVKLVDTTISTPSAAAPSIGATPEAPAKPEVKVEPKASTPEASAKPEVKVEPKASTPEASTPPAKTEPTPTAPAKTEVKVEPSKPATVVATPPVKSEPAKEPTAVKPEVKPEVKVEPKASTPIAPSKPATEPIPEAPIPPAKSEPAKEPTAVKIEAPIPPVKVEPKASTPEVKPEASADATSTESSDEIIPLRYFINEFNRKAAIGITTGDAATELLKELAFLESLVEKTEEEEERRKKGYYQQSQFFVTRNKEGDLIFVDKGSSLQAKIANMTFARSHQQQIIETETKSSNVYDRIEPVLLPEEIGLLNGLDIKSLESLRAQNLENLEIMEKIDSLSAKIGKIEAITNLLGETKAADDIKIEDLSKIVTKLNESQMTTGRENLGREV